MTTRNFKNNGIFKDGSSSTEYDIPDNFTLPNCNIEDVDRALFALFNEQLPFSYEDKKGKKRVPVIFATGERFAILRRKQPLRDRAGALVLPLISIMRTGIEQEPGMGMSTNQTVPMVIKKRLTKEDQVYQRIVNREGLANSDELSISFTASKSVSADDPQKSSDDSDSTRFAIENFKVPNRLPIDYRPKLGNNIFEIITMPPPKYYTATYNVTFWTQYTSQMNDLIMSMMSLYQSYGQRSFKIETPKGYWFIAYIASSLSPGNNFDDFTDEERLVRYSFDVTVPAYLVGSVVPGGQAVVRRSFSAPVFSFTTETVTKIASRSKITAGIQSGKPEDYVLDDIRPTDEPLPGQSIAAKSDADVDSRGPNKSRHTAVDTVGGDDSRSF